MTILEDLFHGNLCPNEYFSRGSKYSKELKMRKSHLFIPFIFLFSTVMLMSVSGCDNKKPVDTSERQFCVTHFNGDIKTLRTLSATNGKDIFYVDGNVIINYQTQKEIAPVEGEICTLTASDRTLYVLYDNYEVCSYDFDGNRLDVLQGQNVIGIAAVKDMVFLSTVDGPLYYKESEPEKTVSISDVICSGKHYGEIDGYCDIYASSIENIDVYSEMVNETDSGLAVTGGFTIFDGRQPRYLVDYCDDRAVFYPLSDSLCKVNSGYFLYYTENGAMGQIRDGLGDYSDNANQFIMDGAVYELLQNPYYHGSEWGCSPYSFNFPQYYAICDRIIADDLESKELKVIFETEDNLTRIIGFDGNTVYLFDVNTYAVTAHDLSLSAKTELASLPQLSELHFEWCLNVLIVYDDSKNVVGIFEC